MDIAEHPLATSFHWQNGQWSEPRSSIGRLEEGWTTAAALAAGDPAPLEELLAYQTRFQRGVDRRTQASYLIATFAHILSLAVAAPFLRSGIAVDFGPSAVAYRFEDYETEYDGRPVVMKHAELRFPGDRFWTADPAAAFWQGAILLADRAALRERFRLMLESHFAALVATVEQMTRLSRAAQWRLVADAVSAAFLDAGRRLGIEETAKADAMAILKVLGSPLDNAQLHYFDLDIPMGEGPDASIVTRSFRARGGCCRYYLTEGGHLCTTCVLEKPAERDRRLREAVQRRLAREVVA
jgi:hypothetical protein